MKSDTPKLAFIIDIAHWPEARCVIYSDSETTACDKACESAKEAGYNPDRGDFTARRSPEYDRFAKELKTNWGYDFGYIEGRIFSRLDDFERAANDLADALSRNQWTTYTNAVQSWSQCAECCNGSTEGHAPDCAIAAALATWAELKKGQA